MIISFELTMPNVASWNGRWSGEGKKYYVVRKAYSHEAKRIKELIGEKQSVSWYYRWEDGWGANVSLEIIDAAEGRKRRKITAGFCGYEWMIESILKYNRIFAKHQEPKPVTA